MRNPLTDKDEHIATVLDAVQGGHSGIPYDQIKIAADHIRHLESNINSIHNLTVTKHNATTKIDIIHDLCDSILGHTK